jgi:hypothetical protein
MTAPIPDEIPDEEVTPEDQEFLDEDDLEEEDEEMEEDKSDGVIRLDLAETRIPVKLCHPTTREWKDYFLVELSGPDRDRFVNALSSRRKITRKGIDLGIRDHEGIMAEFIHYGFYYNDKGKPGSRVPIAMIKKWHSRVQSTLFNKLQEISGMGDDAEDVVKND